MLHNAHAEADPTAARGKKGLKNPWEGRLFDSGPTVSHRNLTETAFGVMDDDMNRALSGGVLRRVLKQVYEYLLQFLAVGGNNRTIAGWRRQCNCMVPACA